MFTLPPRPPRDYVLKEVSKRQLSSPQFTPTGLPRITQTTVGFYPYPIESREEDPPDLSQAKGVRKRIIDLWTDYERATWVDKPGENSYYLHDLFNKYKSSVKPENDARFKHVEKVFQRPYMYELDCLKDGRKVKLCKKNLAEEEEDRKLLAHVSKPKEEDPERAKLVPCKMPPPDWWRDEKASSVSVSKTGKVKRIVMEKEEASLRWQEPPHPLGPVKADWCERRRLLSLFGQPFQHEACLWYFENYPPPAIKFIPEKFSQ